MVPSGPIAGGVLTGGRCEPQVTWSGSAGCPSGPRTGHGRLAVEYRQMHESVAAGVPGTSDAQATAVAWPAAVTLTSQELGTSTSQGSFALPSSAMTLQKMLPNRTALSGPTAD